MDNCPTVTVKIVFHRDLGTSNINKLIANNSNPCVHPEVPAYVRSHHGKGPSTEDVVYWVGDEAGTGKYL